MLFQAVHNDKSPPRGLLEELRVNGNLRDRTDTESAAEITGVADRGAHIESLFYVLIMWEPNQRINVRSDPNLIDAKGSLPPARSSAASSIEMPNRFQFLKTVMHR